MEPVVGWIGRLGGNIGSISIRYRIGKLAYKIHVQQHLAALESNMYLWHSKKFFPVLKNQTPLN